MKGKQDGFSRDRDKKVFLLAGGDEGIREAIRSNHIHLITSVMNVITAVISVIATVMNVIATVMNVIATVMSVIATVMSVIANNFITHPVARGYSK